MNTAGRKDYLLSLIREGKDMRLWDQLQLTLLLAVPAIMAQLSSVMYAFAPELMGLLSSDPDVVALGARVLRIEAFAESFYAVSIVAYGACLGAGDTLIPTILNFAGMWVVRIGLALVLTPRFGLVGYWTAMCLDLNVRGLLFLWHIRGERWMRKRLAPV